jgi:predicted ATPase
VSFFIFIDLTQMRIKSVELKRFKRFHHLRIELPESANVVILAGPNGSGKSSLFEAFNVWHRFRAGRAAVNWDPSYYPKAGEADAIGMAWNRQITLEFHTSIPTDQAEIRRIFYVRSAYRNDPQFDIPNLSRLGLAIDEIRLERLIDNDAVVSRNYQRLASQALEDAFANEAPTLTLGQFREKTIGDIRASMRRVFPDLVMNDLGNPLLIGTFRFDKGTSRNFHYKNLSGGEKAAFDLLLDLIVKRREFNNTVYCIDEPESHMSTKLQAALVDELISSMPGESQLWLATHSIGMLRRARDIERESPGSIVFLDFSDLDFDRSQTLKPARTKRVFWERVLNVALDDLSSLVAPGRVVVCEGVPAGQPSRNTEHDATCYNQIFDEEFPDTKFMSIGNSKDVQSDRLGVVAGIQALVSGCTVLRLIDRDDHSDEDVKTFERQGISVLGRRHLESYLYDDEILMALCAQQNKVEEAVNLLQDKQDAMKETVKRGRAANDIKSASGLIYVKAKQRLSLIGQGNDANAFARNLLVPLITPEKGVYKELRAAIFGAREADGRLAHFEP